VVVVAIIYKRCNTDGIVSGTREMVSGDAREAGGGDSLPAGLGVGKFGVSLPAKSTFAKSADWAAERLAEKRGSTLPPSLIVVNALACILDACSLLTDIDSTFKIFKEGFEE